MGKLGQNHACGIPHPELKSWMFGRCEVRRVPLERKLEAYSRQPPAAKVFESIFSRVGSRLGLFGQRTRWVTFKFVVSAFRWWFRAFNRLVVKGVDRVPDGAIFYANHPGSFDVLLLLAALRKPVSCFFSFGDGWFADLLHSVMGFVSKRPYSRDELIELSIRRLLETNSYFAIWPEGGLSNAGEEIKRGYSSVVRVYSVVNSKRDVVPLVPVLIRGSSCYAYHFTPTTDAISVEFLEPFFLPREWLSDPGEDPRGKTPREIVDWMMMKLARKRGQRELGENRGLERRREQYARENPISS
ncbi:MAG: lysophospholipid acyltransferase family protein [Promethearchaeota archaeon]